MNCPNGGARACTAIRDDQPRCGYAVALQLDGEVLERLGQKSAAAAHTGGGAGFRVLHRLQCAEDAAYRAARPRHHGRARRQLPGDGRAEPLLRHQADADRRRRDVRPHGRELDREDVAVSKSGQVLSWCPSCYVQFTETTIPTIERQGGARPFEMTPFLLLPARPARRPDPLLRREVKMRDRAAPPPGRGRRHGGGGGDPAGGAGHRRSSIWSSRRSGCRATARRACLRYKRELQRNELEAARDAGIDALVDGLSFRSSRTYARMNATGRFASSMCWKSSAQSMGLAPARPLQGAEAACRMPTRSSPNART